MILYPAMDLMDGRIVRLAQGRFDEVTAYPADPAEALARFAEAGAQWAHVVDLSGTRAGAPAQHGLLAALAASAPLKLQVAGGFRTAGQMRAVFEAGVARIVIGSLAVDDPAAVQSFLDAFGPERVALALDVKVEAGKPVVHTKGWTRRTGLSLWEVAALYPSARHLLLTDIGRDGMLAGPNFELLEQAAERLPHLAVQASGGVSSLEDLSRLRAAGAIVGKALWEGRIDLAEALHACA
ncbi:MAG TPA: 1-(5-phosphoribosyl)-5-[(5-phosphoribosylamino)methylideneamino] imidazole-4-carboxamide isomerase [Allosphingosinicella sp.]|jgi:phosphoribosylformimino-5-aminoimidazole carboxamide ribotide isomerase